MTLVVLPRVELTVEDLCLKHIHRRYVAGEIDAAQMEADVDDALRGRYDLPMGGMPPPDTAEPETR